MGRGGIRDRLLPGVLLPAVAYVADEGEKMQMISPEKRTPENTHNCGIDPKEFASYGEAIELPIDILTDGSVWIHNSEYSSRIFFCPWCGKLLDKNPKFSISVFATRID